MLNNKRFTDMIKDYQEDRSMTRNTKIEAITLMRIAIIFSAIFYVEVTLIQVATVLLSISVFVYIIRLPTQDNLQRTEWRGNTE